MTTGDFWLDLYILAIIAFAFLAVLGVLAWGISYLVEKEES